MIAGLPTISSSKSPSSETLQPSVLVVRVVRPAPCIPLDARVLCVRTEKSLYYESITCLLQ